MNNNLETILYLKKDIEEIKRKNKRLKLLLNQSKIKIECYIAKFGLEYPGGAPVSTLLRNINTELNNE